MRALRSPATRSPRRWWLALSLIAGLAAPVAAPAQAPPSVRVVADSAGARLQVDGRDFFVRGMNWDYFPVGQNYAYTLWTQPDATIRAALDREMSLLRAMGVNVIRQYAGIPPRWVAYIHEKYGIYTMLNHPLGRYGVTVGGVYQPNTDYSDPRVRAQLTKEVLALVDEFKGTPGVLMWLLGNENNYGLQWRSAATENLPVGEREAAKARYLYSLVGEVTRAIKARDAAHPVAWANGDLQYLDIVAREAKGIDIFGSNVYRGRTFGDLFQRVQSTLGIPVMFTEFGADAWNARDMREDQLAQASYLLAQWQDIYEHARGQGLTGNAIGGFTFQWSDGWWKAGQDANLGVHDTQASWANAAYAEDYVAGQNNMNEEWWGIVAKGPVDARGQFELYPRAAYYALQRALALDPYAPATDRAAIRAHFAAIDPMSAVLTARADHAALEGDAQRAVRISGMRLDLATFSTGGHRISTPEASNATTQSRPGFQGFDRLESFYLDVTAQPAETFSATVSLNVLGNVPDNPIDELFFENRGRTRTVTADGQPLQLHNDRVRVYRADATWDARDFAVHAFYRTGHYHWGYEGDFFGLYREANYGRNIDIYSGDAPLGVEITGKRKFDGLKLAFGPQLWWGANPSAYAKYRRRVGRWDVTGVYQEDLASSSTGGIASSVAVPLPPTRRASLSLAGPLVGPFAIEAGGLWGGATKLDDHFQIWDRGLVLDDSIRVLDTFGAKAKLTAVKGRYSWYAQGALMGLVADGGPTAVQTYTGWRLTDTGLSDQWNVMTGVNAIFGSIQVAPNVLYQKPIVGPMPADVPQPGRLRNVTDDPFVVRANREMAAGELLVTFDPTPGTWMHGWDSDMREDARFAASVGYVYKHMPTSMDAAIGLLADGRTPFAFPASTPARDLWELRTRIVARPLRDVRLIANLFDGTAEPTGDSPRKLHRWGGDLRVVRQQLVVQGAAKFNDWGPYDYHRDFNLTFPQQYTADVSTVFGAVPWTEATTATRIGLRGTWRSLDRFSPRYCPVKVPDNAGLPTCDPTAPAPHGDEWEIRSYLTIAW